MTKHTPTPVSTHLGGGPYDVVLLDATGKRIGLLDEDPAAFIVRAVNSLEQLEAENARLKNAHEESQTCLKHVAKEIEAAQVVMDGLMQELGAIADALRAGEVVHIEPGTVWANRIQKAIAKAEGKQD